VLNLNQQEYRKLISGQSCGQAARFLRFPLRVAAAGYSAAVRLRNFLYSKGWLKVHRVNALVISIGNITAGGTGKTPFVIWLCSKIAQNYSCAILTRGYKAAKNSDEPELLAKSCPQAKVIVNPDRLAAAVEAVSRFDAEVLLMDDGFQHRSLSRDLDIVMIDSTEPFGYGRMLPAGLLREPADSLKRAQAVVITRCDQVAKDRLEQLEEKLRLANPDLIIARAVHKPVCAKTIAAEKISIEELSGKKVFAFCGIGNPGAFLATVGGCEARLVGSKVYNDHYRYTEDCLADIYRQAEQLKADFILTTQKDWTKIISSLPSKVENKPVILAYLKIELKFTAAEDRITQLIEDALAGKM